MSALPYILSFIGTIGSGQLADWLRYKKILTTGEARKVFGTAGKFRLAVSFGSIHDYALFNNYLPKVKLNIIV